MDLAIQNGLKSEGITSSDILGTEVDQGDTLVFYHKGLLTGVASISKGNKGFSWYRSTPYASTFTSEQPFGTIYYDVESENKHSRTVVTGVVNSSKINELNLFVKGSLLQSKVIKESPSTFYFLIEGGTLDGSSIEVKAS